MIRLVKLLNWKGLLGLLQIAFVLYGCIPRKTEVWRALSYDRTPAYFMEISSIDNNLWVAGPLLPFADRIKEDGRSFNIETIEFLKEEGIVQVCMSDKMWFFLSDMELISYDIKNKSRTDYSQFKNLPRGDGKWPGCAVVQNKIMVWRSNWVATYTDSWDIEILPEINPIVGRTQDAQGREWLILTDGALYQRDDNEWSFFKKLDMQIDTIGLFTITPDDIMWIGAGNNLYRWSFRENSQLDLVLQQQCDNDFSHPNFLRVFREKTGGIIIISACGIWFYDHGDIRNIEMPHGERAIHSAAYNVDKRRLYIGASKIYYMDF